MAMRERRKNLLTPQGYNELVEELEHLTTVRRREVAEHIRQAKADGDISENAGYDEAKEEQGFVEGRIKTLEMLLKNAVVVNGRDQENDGTIAFGTQVTLKAQDSDQPESYLLVGSAEADPIGGKISLESPLGKALLGRGVGDEVLVETPGGLLRFQVVDCR